MSQEACKFRPLAAACLLVLSPCAARGRQPDTVADFYRGKTVTLVGRLRVPAAATTSSPGRSPSTWAGTSRAIRR